jgi:hypothetical protein
MRPRGEVKGPGSGRVRLVGVADLGFTITSSVTSLRSAQWLQAAQSGRRGLGVGAEVNLETVRLAISRPDFSKGLCRGGPRQHMPSMRSCP